MQKPVTWLYLSLLMVAAILLASCGTSSSATSAASSAQKTTTTEATTTIKKTTGSTIPIALTVIRGSHVDRYSLADLQALTSIAGNGGTKGQSGTINGPFTYQGVALYYLMNVAGGMSSLQNIRLTGSDGKTTILTYDQIYNGGFSTYDTSGNPVSPATKPTFAVIYSKNGTLLDSTIGPLEVGLLSSQGLITDEQLWPRMITQIEIYDK